MLTAQAKLFQLITDFLRYIVVREDPGGGGGGGG